MRSQRLPPQEWIVSDGGVCPVVCNMGQVHLHHPSSPGAHNFLRNLKEGVSRARGEFIVFMEDDDFYFPSFLEVTRKKLSTRKLVGGIWQPYYNVRHRAWKLFRNRGSSLCQTGMHRSLIPLFLEVVEMCQGLQSYGVDGRFWDAAKKQGIDVEEYEEKHVIGIKGIAGQVGLGVGHRPKEGWMLDPQMIKLREWVGEIYRVYAGFYRACQTI